jgi:hypothetical protein
MITYLSRDSCNSLKERGIVERTWGSASAILSRLWKKGILAPKGTLAATDGEINSPLQGGMEIRSERRARSENYKR